MSSAGPAAVPRVRTSAQINGSGLSADALLAASAQASEELQRMLRKDERARSRSRSPHGRHSKSAAANSVARLLSDLGSQPVASSIPDEDDPFLVHTVASSASAASSSANRPRSRSPHGHRSSNAVNRDAPRPSASVSNRAVAVRPSGSQRHRSSASIGPTSTDASESDRDRAARRERKARKEERKQAARSRSRSHSRPRQHSMVIEPARAAVSHAQSHHVQRDGRHRSRSPHQHHSSSTHSRTNGHTHTRSRSHSRNRYPDGLAPPLQAVGGEPDYELRAKYIDPFEESHGNSPPMSPGMMAARAALEEARREREDAEMRLLMADQQRRADMDLENQRRRMAFMGTSGLGLGMGAGYEYDPFASERNTEVDSPRCYAPTGNLPPPRRGFHTGQTLPFNAVPAGGLNAGLLCQLHPDQSLSLYCRTCQHPVCRDCVTPLFKGKHIPPAHDVDLLTNVLASTESELRKGTQSLQSVVSNLDQALNRADRAVTLVESGTRDVKQELKDSFALVRTAVLRALADREAKLEADLLAKASVKESRLVEARNSIVKVRDGAQTALEAATRILGSSDAAAENPDIFSIKALLDVRAAIAAGNNVAPPLSATAALLAPEANAAQDVLLRVKPRDLIRTLENAIMKQGGIIAAIPGSPSFVSFAASGTALVLTWAPSALPVEGEVLEYTLDVCEIPRAWHATLRHLNPSLFPTPAAPNEDSEEEEKWNGVGSLVPSSRAAVNWIAVGPGMVGIGGPELQWKIPGGADWAGPFTTLYSGEVTSVKHDNLNLLSAYIYRLTVKNDLGNSTPTYSMPCTLPCMHLSYSSDMDNGGLVSYFGSAGASAPWSNPALVGGLLEITASSLSVGECTTLTSRAAGTLQTLNRHLSWVRIDIGRAQPFRLQLTQYTLAHCGRGVGVRRAIRNWSLQGSVNAIDWVTLREHVNDHSLAAVPLATASWSVAQPAPIAYRYFRILQTDVNQANDHHLALGQIELYGWLVRD